MAEDNIVSQIRLQIRCLINRGARVDLVPWDHDFAAEDFDGLFLSNGPGDPTKCSETIVNISKYFGSDGMKPIFGICLGHQLAAVAAGCKTYKLKYELFGWSNFVLFTVCYLIILVVYC